MLGHVCLCTSLSLSTSLRLSLSLSVSLCPSLPLSASLPLSLSLSVCLCKRRTRLLCNCPSSAVKGGEGRTRHSNLKIENANIRPRKSFVPLPYFIGSQMCAERSFPPTALHSTPLYFPPVQPSHHTFRPATPRISPGTSAIPGTDRPASTLG